VHSKCNPPHRKRSPQPACGQRDPRYKRSSNVGLRPEKFFNSRIKLAAVCPETALMYAVLEDAFLCFHQQFDTEQRFGQRAREAKDWFFSDDSRWLFSFVSVCYTLGLEPEYLRRKLKPWINPIPPRHSTGKSYAALQPTRFRDSTNKSPTEESPFQPRRLK
jgi:hypothetical protein